ncbi:uncharacterized protein [Littorina saxatilis]|uniref:uncharacterized protein isoform X1 n=1 Tax=Littorina saxatilis TaxID=31220 RepID=UPI0038B64990
MEQQEHVYHQLRDRASRRESPSPGHSPTAAGQQNGELRSRKRKCLSPRRDQTAEEPRCKKRRYVTRTHPNSYKKLRLVTRSQPNSCKKRRPVTKTQPNSQKTEFQKEKASHQDTAKQLQEEKARHKDTAKQLQEEKARHKDTAKQLQKEKASHKDTAKQLQKEKASHKDTAKQLQKEKARYQNTAKQLQKEKASHQDTARQLQDSKKACNALEKDVASYQLQLRELRNKAFRFHDNHGEEVVLTNDQQTAEYRRDLAGDGIVMSRDPMNVNTLYEVRVTKTNQRRDWSLWVGVVTSSPDSLAVPVWVRGWKSAVYVARDCFLDHGEETLTNIGKDLVDLPEGSRVGVRVDRSRRLHLHINGVDRGVVPCQSLPDPCWAMWQLWGPYREITSLPVTDVS